MFGHSPYYTYIGVSEDVVIMVFQFDFQWESIFNANKAYYIVIKEFTEKNIPRFFRIEILFDVFILQLKLCLIVVN